MFIRFAEFFVVGLGVYVLSLLLRCSPLVLRLAHPRRSAIHALISVSISIVILTALMLPQYFRHAQAPLSRSGKVAASQPPMDIGSDIVSQVIILLIYAGPASLFIWRGREPLRSAGISTHNLVQAAIIGSLLAALVLQTDAGSLGKLRAITLGPLFYYACVGFGEEFLFRGYLQSRLIAWRGVLQGWILASVIMALAHLPGRMLVQNLQMSDVLGSSVSLIPASLLMGFVMLRTGNIIAPALAHLFANYASHL